jgi:hypothetical protein
MGGRHSRFIANCTGEPTFRCISFRVLHEMDRGQSTCEDYLSTLISFVWQRIICRFGVPSYITVDNGKQFDYTDFMNFCGELGIKLAFASVNHPENNREVKRANGLIFSSLSKALFDMPKGKWVQELVTAVWHHNISCTRTMGFTPISPIIRRRSHHARRAQVRIISH